MPVIELIAGRYGGMSGSQKKIARNLQENPETILFGSLAAFSGNVGCSEATVIRFANHLGFSGYSELQKKLRDELLASTLKHTGPAPQNSGIPYDTETQAASARMAATCGELDLAEFDRICDELMRARQILVAGYMDSFGVAAQLLHVLDGLRPSVDLSRLLMDPFETLRRIHQNTLCLLVSFAPHYRFTYEIAETAARRESKVVLISDSPLNPLAGFATHMLCVKTTNSDETGSVDVSAAMHLVQLMAQNIAKRHPQKVQWHRETSLRWLKEEFLE